MERVDLLGVIERIDGSTLLAGFFVSGSRAVGSRQAPNPVSEETRRAALQRLAEKIREARLSLERLERHDLGTRVRSVGRGGSRIEPPLAISASPLALDPTETAATLRSVEEINTTPTSFGPLDPLWSGLGISTAQPLIGGSYSGENGAGLLSFRVTKDGTHGEDDLDIKVYDPAGDFLEKISIRKNDPIDEVYELENGLTLQLGAGDLVDDDEFGVAVLGGPTPSFSPTQPIWGGVVSTGQGVFGGVYDGSSGDDTLRFVVEKDGIHGEDDLEIEVFDSSGKIDEIRLKKNDPLDEVYTLDNGLTFTLLSGELLKDDEFTLDVFSSQGAAIDPDAPLDGTGVDAPGLEPGFSVSPGSFEVNGVAIDVLAGDTLNDVLARIEASAAGVTARFESATEQVLLSHKTTGPGPTIEVGNDSSGFLAATKLDSASVVPGTVGEAEIPIAQVPALAGVASGSFQVNGVDIAIDVDTDSVADVLARISASNAGATASFDGSSRLASIVSKDPSQDLLLEDAETGFLAALDIATGLYEAVAGQVRRFQTSIQKSDLLERDYRDLQRALTAVFGDATASIKAPGQEQLNADASQALREFYAERFGETSRSTLRTGLGIDFHLGSELPAIEFDAADFRDGARRNGRELFEFLHGKLGLPDDRRSGLVDVLDAVLEEAQGRVEAALGFGTAGRFVDLRA